VTPTILAYLDPGSSSMIVQMFLGGLAAAGVALKLYWRRFLRLFGIRKDDEEKGAPALRGTAAGANGAGPESREPVESTKG
jgi:hypothetical protein